MWFWLHLQPASAAAPNKVVFHGDRIDTEGRAGGGGEGGKPADTLSGVFGWVSGVLPFHQLEKILKYFCVHLCDPVPAQSRPDQEQPPCWKVKTYQPTGHKLGGHFTDDQEVLREATPGAKTKNTF